MIGDKKMHDLVLALKLHLGRLPTEDEVVKFINGTEEEKTAIWNSEVEK